MDHGVLTDHLRQAEEHVALGERHIARQREIVAELEADGHDVTEPRRLLALFEEVQALHVQGRDRLQELVAQAAKPAGNGP